MDLESVALAKLPPIRSPTGAKHFSPRLEHQYEGLTGPKYTVGNKTVKYNLPQPTTLKPYRDTNAGALETWPAHASGNAAAASNTVALCRHPDDAKASMLPKPKFLESLEEFLKKELKALGVSHVTPSELRLQAHREVFEYLIEDFKTYKPLLSAIKNEYEMMLAAQRQHIRQMEPLKQMLVTVSEQCDQKVMALREEEKQEIVDLKSQNRQLHRKIDSLREEQVSLEAQVERLQEELAAEYLRYRDECDARKMLVADINDLRYQQEDNLMSKQSMEELEEGEKDDPITLKIALKKAREDEAAATRRLHRMEADYGDVIPRRDNEALQKQHDELIEQMDTIQNDFTKLKDDHDTLLDQYKSVLSQRDEYYVDCQDLRRNATPRPDWGKAADVVAGGINRWKTLSDKKSSQELVDVLLQELSGGGDSDAAGAEYFDSRGTGDEVPKYLQFDGEKVRNRRLGKRDCALLVTDIWREKIAEDAQNEDGSRSMLSEFVHTYLGRRFGLQTIIVEWAYNLHDACERYAHDANIGLFWRVLNGEADEELHHSQRTQMDNVLTHLTKQDIENNGTGTLEKDAFRSALQEYYPLRTEDHINVLLKAAEVELDAKDSETIDYKNLFHPEEEDGRVGPFLDEVRKQDTDERLQYCDDIKAELAADSTRVSWSDMEKALIGTDPEIEAQHLEQYLCWMFGVGAEQGEPVELEYLNTRMRNGNLKRIGPKPV